LPSTELIILLGKRRVADMVRFDYSGKDRDAVLGGRLPEKGGQRMPLFLIERNFAEELELTATEAAAVKLVNSDVGVNWLFSFLSADKKKTFCLYEAPSIEAIREAARRNNLPADVVIEVSEIRPEAFV
jgi:hypothetical protein